MKKHSLLLVLFLLSGVAVTAQVQSQGWDFACTGKAVEVVGTGLIGPRTSGSISIPNPATVQEIVVESTCKYACPTSVTFSIPNGPQVVAVGENLPRPNSSWVQPHKIYRAHFPQATNAQQVDINGITSPYFQGITAFVVRSNSAVLSNVGRYMDKSFYRDGDSLVIPIAVSTQPRNIEVTIHVGDLEPNGRTGYFEIRAGGLSASISQDSFDPALGPNLNLIKLSLNDVPGTADKVVFHTHSPYPGGDSYFVGSVAVQVECDRNRAPRAQNDYNLTSAGTGVVGNVLTNDSDPDGDPLTVQTTPVSGPTGGTVTLQSDGTYTYTPNPGFSGIDLFSYAVCDGQTPPACDTAVVSITVVSNPPGNDGPLAADDYYDTYTGISVSGNVLGNDVDPDGDPLTVTGITSPPQHGTLSWTPDGSFVYTPDSGFVGVELIEYQVCDNGTPPLCSTANLEINVLPPFSADNLPPFAMDDAFTTPAGTNVSGDLSLNDGDPDNDPLTYTVLSQPATGTLNLNSDGTFDYEPATGVTGDVTFTYTVCDDGAPALCATATVVITVYDNPPGNNGPIAADDFILSTDGSPSSGNVLDNDSDPDGDPLTVTQIVTTPSNGTVSMNPDGSFTYVPDPGFEGSDSFEYEVCDNGTPALCSTAIVRVQTGLPPANRPPQAQDDFFMTMKDVRVEGDVSPNDSDPDGDDLSFSLINGPQNGTLAFNNDGSFIYTPNSGYSGPDRFVYQVCDNGNPQACEQATAYLLMADDITPCVQFDLGVFLQGAFIPSTGLMSTKLNRLGLLPGQNPNFDSLFFPLATPAGQPYNVAPWFYAGTEGANIGDMPGGTPYPATVTDWVLVSLRKNGNAPADEVFKQAALLHNNGAIQFLSGCSQLQQAGAYWLVIEHRNHVGVMTPQPVEVVNVGSGRYALNFDFRIQDSFSDLFTRGQITVSSGGLFGMIGADPQKIGFDNFEINGNDNTVWLNQNGSGEQYSLGDLNLDSEVNGNDRSIWLNNNGIASGVPK